MQEMETILFWLGCPNPKLLCYLCRFACLWTCHLPGTPSCTRMSRL